MNYNSPIPQSNTKKGSKIKIGLIIVGIGLLGGAVPTLGSFITLLILIGAIMVFLGARDLSNTYRKFATISLVLIFIMIIIELYASIKMITSITGLASMIVIPYSFIIKIVDPFIFFISIAYVLLGASLLFLSYPIYMKNARFIPWIIYALTFFIFLFEMYTQMVALNKMYYQNVTVYNIGVFTSVSNGIDDGAAIFMFLWAIGIFIAYYYSRKRFPKTIQPFGQNQPAPNQQSNQYYSQNQNVNPGNTQDTYQNAPIQGNLYKQNGIYCPTCGTLNPPDSKFCVKCGSKLQ